MDALRFLAQLEQSENYDGQIVHAEVLRSRAATFGELPDPLPEALRRALNAQGVESLYVHQCMAVDRVRSGKDLVIVSGTASGKTLCYNAPVIEKLLEEPSARALYLFPTKALAQDQLRGLQNLAESDEEIKKVIRAATYDGDTPQSSKRRIRDTASIILSNPDMLHAGILPAHPRWAKFFAGLKFVVIDELHTCRGVFGSQVANVMRRMLRLCEFYGSRPQFITCSATIANPKELADGLTGRDVELIDEDGAPRGSKYFVLWNPPFTDRSIGERRSANVEAQDLIVQLMEERVQSIAFTRARVLTELLYRYARQSLEEKSPHLAEKIRPYRGGYLASERREIEQQLFSGELLGVTATSALELGIDVGSLDACVLVGFPGTIASTWQQAGRAGRGNEESLVILVAYNDPIDQFLIRHPEYFFGQTPEHAIIDPDNVFILTHHLMCAAAEMPLREEDARFFGPVIDALCQLLSEEGLLKKIADKWYWSSSDVPSRNISLRSMSGDNYTVFDASEGRNETIGEVDGHRAFEIVHPEAVYLHAGESYIVRGLDLEAKTATVEQLETDYYTRPIVTSQIQVGEIEDERNLHGQLLRYGDATVTRTVEGFYQNKLYTLETIGHHTLDLPPRELETKSLWMTFAPEVLDQLDRADWLEIALSARRFAAMGGARNALLAVLPMVVMCERHDVGGLWDTRTLAEPAIFLYDRYPGGLGFTQRAYEQSDQLFRESLRLVDECDCENGCPSCVSRPTLPDSTQELGTEGGGWAESKAATLLLLHLMNGST